MKLNVVDLIQPLFSKGIVSGQYPLEEPGGIAGGPLSQMCEAVNNIDRSNPEMFQNKVGFILLSGGEAVN